MKHTHKYERIRYKKTGFTIFKCQLPDCNHWTRSELIENRRAICWRCENVFILTKRHAELKKPHCDSCTKPRNVKMQVEEQSIQEFLKKISNL